MRHRMKIWVAAILLAGGVMFQAVLQRVDAKPLLNAKAPVVALSDTQIVLNPQATGFQATLPETLTYHHRSLPEGTMFVGTVTQTDFDIFELPAHQLAVQIAEVVFPNGRTLTFPIKPGQLTHPNLILKATDTYLQRSAWINAGQSLKLYFSPQALKQLFQASRV